LKRLTRFMKPGINIMIAEGTLKPYCSISYIIKDNMADVRIVRLELRYLHFLLGY